MLESDTFKKKMLEVSSVTESESEFIITYVVYCLSCVCRV